MVRKQWKKHKTLESIKLLSLYLNLYNSEVYTLIVLGNRFNSHQAVK